MGRNLTSSFQPRLLRLSPSDRTQYLEELRILELLATSSRFLR